MTEEHTGTFCLVLHAHVPLALNHGQYPHGEHWLFEAAAECYIPLLDILEEMFLHGTTSLLTVGLTPILLEQLSHARFQKGFVEYLNQRQERAKRDETFFVNQKQEEMAKQANNWNAWYKRQETHFERIDRDIPRAFAKCAEREQIELLTGPATHAYLPLLKQDACIRAQLKAGISITKRRLGQMSGGMWLPECAYRPTGPCSYSLLDSSHGDRAGIDELVHREGISHLFLEQHRHTPPITTTADSAFRILGPDGRPTSIAMNRHIELCENVWNSKRGFPGSPPYLEFHKRHDHTNDPPGLRYWCVTNRNLDLAHKDLYVPSEASKLTREHARMFCGLVRSTLRSQLRTANAPPLLVACFDAELFGHWWFEGPEFLRGVLMELSSDPNVRLSTSRDRLDAWPPKTAQHVREGSWGENGDHSVWLNQKTRVLWKTEHQAESRFLDLLTVPHLLNHDYSRSLLAQAGRELLLMQASDWPFLIHTEQAADYAMKRFFGHANRFDNLCNITAKCAAGQSLNDLDRLHIADAELHDPLPSEIDLEWWTS